MRNVIPFIAVVALSTLFTTGCAGPDAKLGRGIDNFHEVVRLGEMRRSIEQTAIFDSPGIGYTYGAIHGFHRSLGRAGLGLYEVLTFPFPPYHPILTKYYAVEPVYPANYKPGLISDSMFDTDTYFGYGGGEVARSSPAAGSVFLTIDHGFDPSAARANKTLLARFAFVKPT